MALREYAGGAKRTTLAAAITAASTTITVTDATGYPTGATGPFAIALDVGLAGEEKVLIQSRSGNTLTVAAAGRGYDGTTAASHASATVDHVITAIDLREANAHVNDTTGDPHPQYKLQAEVLRYTQAIDLPSLPANSATDVVVTTTPSTVASSSSVVLYQAGIATNGLVLQRIASVGVDTFTLRILNYTAAALDPGSATFVFLIVNP